MIKVKMEEQYHIPQSTYLDGGYYELNIKVTSQSHKEIEAYKKAILHIGKKEER